MRSSKSLKISLLSDKVEAFSEGRKITPPQSGWISAIRTTLNMTLEQLGNKAGKTKQTMSKLEKSEAEGGISLASLRDTAQALDMQLVYAIVPREETLEAFIEKRARALAVKIVRRTNRQMLLEAQEIEEEKLQQAIDEMTIELVDQMDRRLWE